MSDTETSLWTLGGIGAAITALASWGKPFVERWLLLRLDRMEAQTEAIRLIPQMKKRLRELVLYVAVLAEHVGDRRSAILIVEDSKSDAMMASAMLSQIAKDKGLEIIIASTHSRARHFLMRSLIAVVDVHLPDSTPEDIRHFIEVTGIPCVVYTSDDIEPDFFGETPVVSKGDGEALKQMVSRILER